MDQFSIFVWDCKTATTMRAAEAQDKVDGGTVLQFVVRECAAIFQSATRKDQSLLFRRSACLFLNLDLDALNGVTWFNLQMKSLATQSLDVDFHVLNSEILFRLLPSTVSQSSFSESI